MKSTKTYWNPLAEENSGEWEIVDGADGKIAQLTIALDPKSDGANRRAFY
jgi:hypothetical protein